jgi:hypothetical protein
MFGKIRPSQRRLILTTLTANRYPIYEPSLSSNISNDRRRFVDFKSIRNLVRALGLSRLRARKLKILLLLTTITLGLVF